MAETECLVLYITRTRDATIFKSLTLIFIICKTKAAYMIWIFQRKLKTELMLFLTDYRITVLTINLGSPTGLGSVIQYIYLIELVLMATVYL